MKLTIEFEGTSLSYDNQTLPLSQLKVIKAHTGLGLTSWLRAVQDGDPDALQALMWVVQLQNGQPWDINADFNAAGFYEAVGEAGNRAAQAEADAAGEGDAADPTPSRTPDSTSS